MFVAIRDIRFAKGRFTLMGAVVALITLLIVLLAGLTAGLADESTSGIKNLPGTHVAFGAAGDAEPEQSFTDSSVTGDQVAAWNDADGIAWAEPLGLSQTRLTFDDDSTTAVTVFGAEPGTELAPADVAANELVIGEEFAAEHGLAAGDQVTIGPAELTVAHIDGAGHYAHTPVVWTALQTWQSLRPEGASADGSLASVLVAEAGGDAATTADIQAIDEATGTVSTTISDSLTAIGAFASENTSLMLIQGFLYVISALVVGAFLTVWTVQRTGDIAILKALGGSTRYLMRDALTQALVVLVLGAGLGGAAGVAAGAVASGVVPFVLDAATTVVPVVGLVVLGMGGALLAVRRINSVDPLTALGALR